MSTKQAKDLMPANVAVAVIAVLGMLGVGMAVDAASTDYDCEWYNVTTCYTN